MDSSYISKIEDVGMSSSMCVSMPKTIGVFEYAQWIVDKLEPEHHEALKGVLQKTTYMGFCAGLGTSLIAIEAPEACIAALHRCQMYGANRECSRQTRSPKAAFGICRL